MSGPPSAKILVVDDETYVCELLVRSLTSVGYKCASAFNVDMALKAMEKEEFQLVLSDIIMPGRSGIELLHIIRDRYPDVAVLMVTAIDDRQTGIMALEAGAFGYLIKPLERNELLINVVNALERRSERLASREYERHLAEHVRTGSEQTRKLELEMVRHLVRATTYGTNETEAHMRRVGMYSSALAETLGLGWTLSAIEDIRIAAALHDVGKIGIPYSIMSKPEGLTEEEFEWVKKHPEIGARILGGSASELLDMAREICVAHHEKWDGSGYPQGLAGKAIPESARIVAIADVYDVLLQPRVFREAFPEDQALNMMSEQRGKHFDPEMLDCFFSILTEIRRVRHEISEESFLSSGVWTP
jgi:putative two-component system response regulator